MNVYSNWKTRDEDLKELEKNRPELKYFIKKQHIHDVKLFMKTLNIYIEHPEIEPLLELNLIKVATDKRLFNLSEKKRKQVMNYIKTHLDEIADEISLQQILCAIADTTRPRRRRLNKKEKRIQEMMRIEDYNSNLMKIGGYSIFIPNSLEQCELQANKLNQCIISCDYVRDMGKKKLVLIFIQKDGNPIATCEIDNQTKEIKQFYADEHDRDNCLPTRKMRNAMNEYIAQLDLSKLYIGA